MHLLDRLHMVDQRVAMQVKLSRGDERAAAIDEVCVRLTDEHEPTLSVIV